MLRSRYLELCIIDQDLRSLMRLTYPGEGGGGALPQASDPARPVHVPEGRHDPGVLVLVTHGDGGG